MLRCNNDGKVLTNGEETRGITYYILMYVTKKQGRSFNMSALWSHALAYHFQDTEYMHDLQERQRKLLFRAINVLNREQEIAAPLVMSYLLGNGDTYRSHQHVAIYTSTLYSAVQRAWPTLRQYVLICCIKCNRSQILNRNQGNENAHSSNESEPLSRSEEVC